MTMWNRVWLVAFAASLLFGLKSIAIADQAPETITIATWNLEWFFDAHLGDNESDLAKEQSAPSQAEWDWKKGVVAKAIAQFKPTILCLQEIENRKVLMELADELKKKYQLNYRVAFIEGFDRATEQDVGILYQSGCVEFSRKEQTKEQFDSQQYYNLSKHLFARFEWQADGKTESLTILNVHFRAKAEESALRVRQSKLAKLWVQERMAAGENVLIIGDTNIEEPYAAQPLPGGEVAELTGSATSTPADDMVDFHGRIAEGQRRTHLILDRQFDRFFGSKSLVEDAPDRKDWVLEKVEVLSQHCIRGAGPDLDHWDTRYTKDREERDVSDHYPVMATLRLR